MREEKNNRKKQKRKTVLNFNTMKKIKINL